MLHLSRNTVRRVAAAGTLALCAGAGEAPAADESSAAPSRPPLDEPRTILFNATEIGASAYSNTGFKRTLGPSLHRNGFVLMGNAGAGRQREAVTHLGRRATVDYWSAEAGLLLGYQWRTDRATLSLLAGPEAAFDQTLVDGRVLAPSRPGFGARALAEVWTHPVDDALLVGTLLIGTAPQRAWGRAMAGWRVWGSVFVGPEAVVSVEETYREGRFGLAATGLSFGRWTFTLSAGLLAIEGERPGAYGGLTMVYRP
ncbi:MAG TPA: cellulose biosynthesis protein BcsS [Microvirga sp.]|jgi:hypothetical protein|nr:cellulose biosynthesis protein BcsS [Microvirga sp.]